MAWLLIGGAVVWGLLAFHEMRAGASRLGQRQTGRHASAGLLAKYLPKGTKAAQPRYRWAVPAGVMARRADPTLLYNHLETRQPRVVRPTRPTPDALAVRAARPTRLVPLTA
jgi:hypothetical protein